MPFELKVILILQFLDSLTLLINAKKLSFNRVFFNLSFVNGRGRRCKLNIVLLSKDGERIIGGDWQRVQIGVSHDADVVHRLKCSLHQKYK